MEPIYSNALFSSEFLCDELVIICGTRFPAPLDFLIVPKESGIGILTIIRSILSAHMSYYQGRATFAGVEGIFVEIPVLYNKSGNPRVLFCTADLQRIYKGKLIKDLYYIFFYPLNYKKTY